MFLSVRLRLRGLRNSQLQNSKITRLASAICSSVNTHDLSTQCSRFFELAKFQPQIINFGENGRKNFDKSGHSFIWMQIQVSVPILFNKMGTTHSLTPLPRPVGKSNNKFLFKKYQTPRKMAYLMTAGRKVNLDKCDNHLYNNFFCPNEQFNEIDTRDYLCLNSLWQEDPHCEEVSVSSISNCMFRRVKGKLYISHSGPDSTVSPPKFFAPNQLSILSKKKVIAGEGIFAFNMTEEKTISCLKTTFHYRPLNKLNFTVLNFHNQTKEPIPDFLSKDISLLNTELENFDKDGWTVNSYFTRLLQKGNRTHLEWSNSHTVTVSSLSFLVLLNTFFSAYTIIGCVRSNYYIYRFRKRNKVNPEDRYHPMTLKHIQEWIEKENRKRKGDETIALAKEDRIYAEN